MSIHERRFARNLVLLPRRQHGLKPLRLEDSRISDLVEDLKHQVQENAAAAASTIAELQALCSQLEYRVEALTMVKKNLESIQASGLLPREDPEQKTIV
jgi:hypothetical protein